MQLNYILLQEAQGGFSGIIMIVLLLVVFWIFMIRPQQKQQKQIRKFREGVSKGDKVVTAGGIFGTVAEVKEKHFVLEIAKDVKISIAKDSVYPSAQEANQGQRQN